MPKKIVCMLDNEQNSNYYNKQFNVSEGSLYGKN